MKKIIGGLAVVLLLSASACGYSTHTTLPASIKTVAVLPFVNKIDFTSGKPSVYVPLLETKAHNAVVNQFLFDGVLKVVEPDAADLVLKGELIAYNRSALRYTDNNDVQEYRITVTVHLTMLDRQGETIWEEPTFSGEETYFLSGPKATSENGAIEEAIKDLAKRIVERTVEDW